MNVRVAGVEIWLSERDRTWDRALEMVCTSVADWDGVKDERARVDGYRGRDWRVMAMIHRCCSTTDGGYAERSGLVGALATTERNNSLENPSVPARAVEDMAVPTPAPPSTFAHSIEWRNISG